VKSLLSVPSNPPRRAYKNIGFNGRIRMFRRVVHTKALFPLDFDLCYSRNGKGNFFNLPFR
jgi:hypothetical protein